MWQKLDSRGDGQSTRIRIIKNSLLLLFLILFFGGICEIAFRILGYRGEVVWFIEDVVPKDDKLLNYRLRSNFTTFSGAVSYKMNRHGFRDLEREYEKRENTIRVLVMGDSVAFGYKVKFEDTLSFLLIP
jgi:hypothetical protein